MRARVLVIAAIALACGGPARSSPHHRRAHAEHVAHVEPAAGLDLGEFTITKIVDGDTVRVDGLDASLRLLAIDTEEIPHNRREQAALDGASDFGAYVEAQRDGARHPVKMATPMGLAARDFAAHFFAIGDRVKLERDDPHQIHDRFGRYLAYVFAWKDGAWVNYNVEAVRAGMAPYFTKYGYSRRYDAELRAAEAEAKAAHRGIWSDQTQHYPDYDERDAWWNARADFVAAFDKDAAGRDDFVDLTDGDALDRLGAREGREATVLGTIHDIYMDRGPVRVLLDHARGADFPIVFFDRDVFASTGLAAQKGEFIRVHGTVSTYKGRLQIVVDRASQVVTSAIAP
jgi:endonuclease YncB( thermonuclease family)